MDNSTESIGWFYTSGWYLTIYNIISKLRIGHRCIYSTLSLNLDLKVITVLWTRTNMSINSDTGRVHFIRHFSCERFVCLRNHPHKTLVDAFNLFQNFRRRSRKVAYNFVQHGIFFLILAYVIWNNYHKIAQLTLYLHIWFYFLSPKCDVTSYIFEFLPERTLGDGP